MKLNLDLFHDVLDWFKYERLRHYPALKVFDDDTAALKRLKAYEREERLACRPWLITAQILIVVMIGLWIFVAYRHPLLNALMIVVQAPGWVVQYVLHRRIRRRVEAKVADELRDGRLWKCVGCDYDLRASEARCPECGEPVRAARPPVTELVSRNLT